MARHINRRGFLRGSIAASAGTSLGGSIAGQSLLADQPKPNSKRPPEIATAPASPALPVGTIGKLKISRLICGGNLVAGYAHARDGDRPLRYVSRLMLEYFTEEKILQTLELAEAGGINAIVLNNLERDFKPIRVLNRYWRERGGKIQWIAQCNPDPKDVTANCRMAIDHGAVAAFAQGGFGDRWSGDERIELLGKFVNFAKNNGLIAGIGGHSVDTVKAIEASGIEPDFYFKTLNNVGYNSATPEDTIRLMENVTRPWIAFKVLGAGRALPTDGFQYAFNHGADFICVGMFDFQIRQDVNIARNALKAAHGRTRPWRG